MSHRGRIFRIDPADTPNGWTLVPGDEYNSDQLVRGSKRISPLGYREALHIAGGAFRGTERKPGYGLFDDAVRIPGPVPLPRQAWCLTIADAAALADRWMNDALV